VYLSIEFTTFSWQAPGIGGMTCLFLEEKVGMPGIYFRASKFSKGKSKDYLKLLKKRII